MVDGRVDEVEQVSIVRMRLQMMVPELQIRSALDGIVGRHIHCDPGIAMS